MNHLIVLDTNVVISAGIRSNTPPAQIIELVLRNELILVTCPAIIEEYLQVFARAKFKQFGFPPTWVYTLIRLSHQASSNPTTSEQTWTDPKDAVFYDLAKQYGATLISGNLKNFPADNPQVRVLSPAQFLAAYQIP